MRHPFPALRRPAPLVATLLTVLSLLATACGGGSSDVVEVGQSAPVPEQPAAVDEPAAQARPESEPAPDEAEPAEPTLIAATADGGQLDFGDLEGQDVVLWFWAPW